MVEVLELLRDMSTNKNNIAFIGVVLTIAGIIIDSVTALVILSGIINELLFIPAAIGVICLIAGVGTLLSIKSSKNKEESYE